MDNNFGFGSAVLAAALLAFIFGTAFATTSFLSGFIFSPSLPAVALTAGFVATITATFETALARSAIDAGAGLFKSIRKLVVSNASAFFRGGSKAINELGNYLAFVLGRGPGERVQCALINNCQRSKKLVQFVDYSGDGKETQTFTHEAQAKKFITVPSGTTFYIYNPNESIHHDQRTAVKRKPGGPYGKNIFDIDDDDDDDTEEEEEEPTPDPNCLCHFKNTNVQQALFIYFDGPIINQRPYYLPACVSTTKHPVGVMRGTTFQVIYPDTKEAVLGIDGNPVKFIATEDEHLFEVVAGQPQYPENPQDDS